MVGQSYLQAQIDLLTNDPIFTTPLVLDQVVFSSSLSTPTRRHRKTSTRKKEMESARRLGKIPDLPKGMNSSNPVCEQYGFYHQGKFSRACQYLKQFEALMVPVAADGNCLYNSVVELLEAPQEYVPVMAKRDLILLLTEEPHYFLEKLRLHIAGMYGPIRLTEEEYKQKEREGTITEDERKDYSLPGPFSYKTYLEYMAKPGTWADAIFIYLFSFLYQVSFF